LRPQRAREVAENLTRIRSQLLNLHDTTDRAITIQYHYPIVSSFIGRDKELSEIQRRMNLVIGGESQFILIGGDTGIGKSRLIQDLANLARVRKMRVYQGHFLEEDRSIPYQGFREILQSYFRSLSQPNINSTVDFSDPYNIRFGNEKLEASTADNFDIVVGNTIRGTYINLGVGYNIVRDIFSRVRTLLPDGKTQITWENISGRKEYEVSTWGGLSITKNLKSNISATYTYNQYSSFDKVVNRYRNGSSFTSNVNTTYTPTDTWNFTGSFTFNRFANPQGYAKWNSSMNFGVQKKLFNKKFVITANAIDPFVNNERRFFTYGTNFNHESFSLTHTRNFRISLAYNIYITVKKPTLKL